MMYKQMHLPLSRIQHYMANNYQNPLCLGTDQLDMMYKQMHHPLSMILHYMSNKCLIQ